MKHRLYGMCVLKTHADAQAWFSKGRSPHKGRGFNRWARVFRYVVDYNGGPAFAFNIKVNGYDVAEITPDNKLTLLIDAATGSKISNTLSMSIHRLIPIGWQRVGMKRYRIVSTAKLKAADNYWQAAANAPELYKGLQIDLSTGEFVNAKPDILSRVQPDARLEWVRVLRRFKRGIRTRAKLGVFDSIESNLDSYRRSLGGAHPYYARSPSWSDAQWIDLLHTSMRDDKYPKELLAGFLLSAPSMLWGRTKTGTVGDRMIAVVTRIINANSIELRSRFGVFSDLEVTDEKQD